MRAETGTSVRASPCCDHAVRLPLTMIWEPVIEVSGTVRVLLPLERTAPGMPPVPLNCSTASVMTMLRRPTLRMVKELFLPTGSMPSVDGLDAV